jgi:histidine triad (HIT) family protein
MFSHAPEGYRCPFCALLRGAGAEGSLSAASDIVYEDQLVAAFIGSHQWPNNPGNTLIVPRDHYENIFELPDDLIGPLFGLARAVALTMKAVWRCDGVSMRQHNEPAGSQDVWHCHVHVTPRYEGDDFYTGYARARRLMPAEERAVVACALRERIVALL